jgi:hypothetical protein
MKGVIKMTKANRRMHEEYGLGSALTNFQQTQKNDIFIAM